MEEDALQRIQALTDPVERAKEATRAQDVYQRAAAELARIRKEAINDALSEGISQTELARRMGVTKSRIGQLRKQGPPAERALLSPDGGDLTVIVGQKPGDGVGRVSVAQETVVAYDRLSGLSRSLGMGTRMEVVAPPGDANLNQDNLIVLSGPRLLPTLRQVLEGDRNIRFRTEGRDWWLRDETTGTDYRARPESRVCVGYLGRLPRPDGRGTFLVGSGVRAIGTQGVVAYLEDNLEELYREVKTRRFSTLIRAVYDPASQTVTSTERVSPIYR